MSRPAFSGPRKVAIYLAVSRTDVDLQIIDEGSRSGLGRELCDIIAEGCFLW